MMLVFISSILAGHKFVLRYRLTSKSPRSEDVPLHKETQLPD